MRSLGLTRGPESGGSHGVTLTVDGRMTDVRGMLAREMVYQAAEKRGTTVRTVTENPLKDSMD